MNLITSEVDATLGGTNTSDRKIAYTFSERFHQGHSNVIQMMSPYANCLEEDTNQILSSFCAEVDISLLDS